MGLDLSVALIYAHMLIGAYTNTSKTFARYCGGSITKKVERCW